VPHVRHVVLDTSVVLPAVLSPRGYRRRFFVLLAFGALAARRDLARLEADALRIQADIPGSESGSRQIDSLVQDADARYQHLSKLMPPGCPDHWRLVASPPVLAEYEHKLREAGPRLNPSLGAHGIELARRQIEIVCADVIEDFDPVLIPHYTADRKDDPIVHTALLADATWLIADDRKHISTDTHGVTDYALPGSDHRVAAITFSRFLDHLTDVDLDNIDPTLLADAFTPPSKS
jgi:predicted nucleic acid-binding protein